MQKAVIFDLDGTLIDSAPDIAHALNRLLEERGLEAYDLPTVTSFVGHGAPRLLEQAWSGRGKAREPHQAATDLDRFQALYAEEPTQRTRLYPGAREALIALRAAGYDLGICTNKPEALTHQALKQLGIDGLFKVVVGGDTLPERKPSPEPLELCARHLGAELAATAYVGDSEVDAATADAAGAPFLLHTEGYRKGPIKTQALRAEFSDFARLPELVERLAREGEARHK
ncbi:phosphoglycolate phosphatase [Neomegalonema perideroedes]|uniref:phosphoglycolate phosphatase n=1 Tax=Neomegalonema perideroedes TaxID=217219 RepID=UPI000376AB88|nr:phosphoglycolate phosphatase [Neomegalonema perideroedes]